MNFVVRVQKEHAENVRLKLIEQNVFDFDRKVKKEGDYVLLPVKVFLDEFECFEDATPIYLNRSSPAEEIKKICGAKISGWRKYGDVVIFRAREISEDILKAHAETIAEILKAKSILIDYGVEGEFREPKIKIVYGVSREVEYYENGIVFRFDPTRIMLCAGNIGERIRVSETSMKDEIVVDMFAGIGYFSIPIAKYGSPKRVYACEKNLTAFKYLCENIVLNEVENTVIPIYGDNREIAPEGIADRIVMGYIRTENFLGKAFKILKRRGGTIHYHNVYHKSIYRNRAIQDLLFYAESNGFRLVKYSIRKIKSYSPNLVHFVVDALFESK